MMDPSSEPVRIHPDLHRRVRRHCDGAGIRRVDFVEQALEDAMAAESVAGALENEIERLRRKTVSYDQAFNRGFQLGFSLWFRMTTGMGLSDEDRKELDAVSATPPVVRGEQLTLF